MENVKKEYYVAKWGELIKDLKLFPDEYIEKVSEFAERFSREQANLKETLSTGSYWDKTSAPIFNDNDNLLPLNLRLISKLKDLSKVVFLNSPEEIVKVGDEEVYIKVGTFQCTHDISQQKLADIREQIGIDVIAEVEDSILSLIADKINAQIDMGETIYMWMPISSIAIIVEGTTPPRLLARTRYATSKNLTLNDI